MATLSLSNGTYGSSDLTPADTAGDDSVTVTNATVNAIYSPDGGNDHYSVTGSTVGLAGREAFRGGTGNDTMIAIDSNINGTAINLNDGDDSLYLQNVNSVGVINAGAGNDALELDSVTGASSIQLFSGNNSLTLTDTTLSGAISVSFATSVDNQSIVLNSSSVASSLSTGQSSLNHIVLNDSTIGGHIFANNFAAPAGSPASTLEIINGSQVTGTGTTGVSLGVQADSIHIADSTIGAAIHNGNQGTDATRADTMLIENATFTGSGNQVNLSGNGDQLTVTGSNLGNANINMGGGAGGSFTISVENSTLTDIVNQSSGSMSIDVVDSSMRSFSFQQSQATDSLTINVNNSTVTTRSDLGNGSETVSLLNGSEFGGDRIWMAGGDDKMVVGTDTKFTGNSDSYANDLGLDGFSGNDTLELVGGGAFSISLESAYPATLDDGSTVTLVTNDNWEQVAAWGNAAFTGNIRGTLSLADSDSTVLIQQFESFEAIPCFVNGTMIMTDKGERPVEALRVGDLVQTADAGLQPIRWIKTKPINALNMAVKPAFVPIRIRQGALGNELPSRDLLVSPQHRMLVSGKLVERMFGTEQALCAAVHLLELDGIERAIDQVGFDYVHFMLGDHQVVYAEGAPTETLYVGDMAVDALGDDACKELEDIFPELAQPVSNRIMNPARLFLTGRQGRKLAERASKNNHSLLGEEDTAVAAYSAA